jgi:hypothetical protein
MEAMVPEIALEPASVEALTKVSICSIKNSVLYRFCSL